MSFIPSSPTIFTALFCVQKRFDGGKQGNTNKKMKKDKVVGATAKAHRSESVAVSGAPRVKPELALPAVYVLKITLCSCSLFLLSVLLQ